MTRLDCLLENICEYAWNISLNIRLLSISEKLNKPCKEGDKSFLLEAIEQKLIDIEELYCHWLDRLKFVEDIDEDLLDNPIFDPACYFPEEYGKALSTHGSWIRIKTPKGFNIYFGKPSRHRIDFDRELWCLKQKSLKKPEDSSLNAQIQLLRLQKSIGIDPYFISYQATKTRKKLILPINYECIKDIDLYICLKSKHIKFKSFMGEELNDKIFYLQSRGISKKEAIRLVALSQGYFEIDLLSMINDEREVNGLEKLDLLPEKFLDQ